MWLHLFEVTEHFCTS